MRDLDDGMFLWPLADDRTYTAAEGTDIDQGCVIDDAWATGEAGLGRTNWFNDLREFVDRLFASATEGARHRPVSGFNTCMMTATYFATGLEYIRDLGDGPHSYREIAHKKCAAATIPRHGPELDHV